MPPQISTPAALLTDLRKQGFVLSAQSGRLLVSPASRLTPIQTDAIRINRDAIIAILEGESAAKPPMPSQNCMNPAPRRIVLVSSGEVLAEPSAVECHREFTRLAALYRRQPIAAEWLGPLGWTRWMTSCVPMEGKATP